MHAKSLLVLLLTPPCASVVLSFTANVHENAWEFGVLRAIGLNVSHAMQQALCSMTALVVRVFLTVCPLVARVLCFCVLCLVG